MSAHLCHALECETPVPPEMLMCLKHWRKVPKEIQREVWRTYRRGQCDDMRPSEAWHRAADAAIKAVALREGKKLAQNAAGVFLRKIKKEEQHGLFDEI